MEELNNKFNFKDYITDITNFIIFNYKQIILFLLVFIIIYIVDRIIYHNNLIYASLSIPNIITNHTIKNEKANKIKKNKK